MMSLSSHLSDKSSPIGRFLYERFSGTRLITADPNRLLKAAPTIRPTGESIPYMTLGMAIDYRIRYSFAITPSLDLTAAAGAGQLALKPIECSDDVEVPFEELVDFMYRYEVGLPFNPADGAAQGLYPPRLVDAFFQSLDTTLAQLQPAGRHLALAEEQLLARYCYVLALFDAIYRSGGSSLGPQSGPLFDPDVKRSVEELLAIPRTEWVDDLCALSWLFYDTHHDLLAKPAVLQPVFDGSSDIGGADADLIVDGCLIELKASVSPTIQPSWLQQLVGYLLLDYNDAFKITSLGIYMVRQGMLFTWPVEDLLPILTGDYHTSLAALRQEFYALVAPKQKRARRRA